MRIFCLRLLLALFCLVIGSIAQTPTIINQPQSEQVPVGASVSLSVSATGSEPLRYQWYKNGIALAGATKRTFVLNPAAVRHTGTYKVMVLNTQGSVMSEPVRIEVNNRDARSIPIQLTGWNEDVILENTTVPLASTNFDAQGNYWFEAGLYGHSDGLPAQNEFTSVLNTNVIFAFQPYTEYNVLRLASARLQPLATGILTLITPARYRSISILGAAPSLGASLQLELGFSDGSTNLFTVNIPTGWAVLDPDHSPVSGLGRYQTKMAPLGYQSVQGPGYGMSEVDLDLAAFGLHTKELVSLTFRRSGVEESVVGIFAASGEPNTTPELALVPGANGRKEIILTGFPSISFRIDSSRDLVHWTPIASVAVTNGVAKYNDPGSSQVKSLFYRAQVQ